MEFTGEEFQEMLESYQAKFKPTTVKHLQANIIHKRVYLLITEIAGGQQNQPLTDASSSLLVPALSPICLR